MNKFQTSLKSKYKNKKVTVISTGKPEVFDSVKEYRRYLMLCKMRLANLIKDLSRQVPYKLIVNEQLICVYKADFVYRDVASGLVIVEDVKGFKTDVYKLKKKLMKACYKIDVIET